MEIPHAFEVREKSFCVLSWFISTMFFFTNGAVKRSSMVVSVTIMRRDVPNMLAIKSEYSLARKKRQKAEKASARKPLIVKGKKDNGALKMYGKDIIFFIIMYYL